MAASSSLNNWHSITAAFPDIGFAQSDSFFWSPRTQTVHYNPIVEDSDRGAWMLIHEISHAKLAHTTYRDDFELLQLEVAAWDEARRISKELNIVIDEDHIQDCIDTYRDWLHKRSTCPTCRTVSLQQSDLTYQCHNCHNSWTVSNSRFCRPYRKKI